VAIEALFPELVKLNLGTMFPDALGHYNLAQLKLWFYSLVHIRFLSPGIAYYTVLEVVLCHPGNPAILSSILLWPRECPEEYCPADWASKPGLNHLRM
jgi:hypothetical protein